jgi:ketosteroid isomerase-like protein
MEAIRISERNVETVKALFGAWNAGDMDAVGDLYHPDVIWRVMPDWPEPGPFVGREAVLRQVRQLRETWEGADIVEPISDFIDAGDRVVVRFIWRGAGHGPPLQMELTGVRVRVAGVGVWTEGVIERVTDYADNFAEARAAAERLAQERG